MHHRSEVIADHSASILVACGDPNLDYEAVLGALAQSFSSIFGHFANSPPIIEQDVSQVGIS
jgi:hypothetical protein